MSKFIFPRKEKTRSLLLHKYQNFDLNQHLYFRFLESKYETNPLYEIEIYR